MYPLDRGNEALRDNAAGRVVQKVQTRVLIGRQWLDDADDAAVLTFAAVLLFVQIVESDRRS